MEQCHCELSSNGRNIGGRLGGVRVYHAGRRGRTGLADGTCLKEVEMSTASSGPGPGQPPTDEEVQRYRAEIVREVAGRLAPSEVEAPPRWLPFAETGRVFVGECFRRCYQFVHKVQASDLGPAQKKGVWLVHGQYLGWHDAAWVELPGGLVFDGVLQRFYRRAGYYAAVSARPWYRYDAEAAAFIYLGLTSDESAVVQYGNWHLRLMLPWAADGPVEVAGMTGVCKHLLAAGRGGPRPAQGRRRRSP
jgi:hypothetical protein